MSNLIAPKKPPRVNRIKAVNELDAAQLTMCSTIVNNNNNDNTAKNTTSLTRQLSVDNKAVITTTTTKRKHLHFHSPLVKGPMKMKMATMQQRAQAQARVEQYPDSLFSNIMSYNACKANAITTKDVRQTIETSNITPTTIRTIADHDVVDVDNYSNAHHSSSYEHHGRVSKAMSLKETTALRATEVEATGNTNASTRLDRGCTSLMYACQHGDISEVMAQLSNKVSYKHMHYDFVNFLCN